MGKEESIIDKMREPMQQYNETWFKLQAAIDDTFKDYVPYIVDLGNGLYQINGDSKSGFSYITNKDGAIEADKALKEAVKKRYGNNKDNIKA